MLAGIPAVLKSETGKRLVGTGIGTNVPKFFNFWQSGNVVPVAIFFIFAKLWI